MGIFSPMNYALSSNLLPLRLVCQMSTWQPEIILIQVVALALLEITLVAPQALVRGGPLNAPNFAPSYNSSPRLFCQICLKPSHTRPSCWRRFEQNYQPQPQQNSQAYVAAPQGPTDPTWYLDIGATNNNTSGLGNLNLNTEDYVGQDQVHMENGQGLNIHPIGSSILCSSSKSFFYITFFMSLL
jgi:hypothetical protein